MDPDLPLFLVFNPTSGGTKGEELLALGVPAIRVVDEALKLNVLVHLGDIRDGSPGKKTIFETLKKEVDAQPKEHGVIKIIVAGGDGTVVWAMSEADAHGIDSSRIAFGSLPFGTGNDFSRATGFGGNSPHKIVGKEMSAFKKIILIYLNSDVSPFDLWEVKIVVKENGSIKKIKNGQKVDATIDGTSITKLCCNYYSIGIDARIGIGFDRNRTKSAFCNKTVYACEGFKKSLWTAKRLNETIQSLTLDDGTNIPLDTNSKAKAVSLVFQNIPSIGGGTDLWKMTGGSEIQDFSDGKIELMTVPTFWSFVQARLGVKGAAEALGSISGPFFVKFTDKIMHRCYTQVDGEFYQLECPDTATLNHSRKVQVLIARK